MKRPTLCAIVASAFLAFATSSFAGGSSLNFFQKPMKEASQAIDNYSRSLDFNHRSYQSRVEGSTTDKTVSTEKTERYKGNNGFQRTYREKRWATEKGFKVPFWGGYSSDF